MTEHVVTITRDRINGFHVYVATCRCGWVRVDSLVDLREHAVAHVNQEPLEQVVEIIRPRDEVADAS